MAVPTIKLTAKVDDFQGNFLWELSRGHGKYGTVNISSAHVDRNNNSGVVSGNATGVIGGIYVWIVQDDNSTVYCNPTGLVLIDINGNWQAKFNCNNIAPGHNYRAVVMIWDGFQYKSSDLICTNDT